MYLAKMTKKAFETMDNGSQIERILLSFSEARIEYGEIKDFDSQYKVSSVYTNLQKVKRELGLKNISVLRRGNRIFLHNANCISPDYSEPEGTQD